MGTVNAVICKADGFDVSGGKLMKVFVTGVAGQLGHDVMNELNKRGYEGIGSDIAEK